MRWFRKTGHFYFPSSLMGYVVLAVFLVMAVGLFIRIDSRSHSVSDTLMNVFFNYVLLAAAYSVIGYFTSDKKGTR